MLLLHHSATGVKSGGCAAACTPADRLWQRVGVSAQFLMKGISAIAVYGEDIGIYNGYGPFRAEGKPLSCEHLFADPSGLKFVSSVAMLNQAIANDIVVENCFEALRRDETSVRGAVCLQQPPSWEGQRFAGRLETRPSQKTRFLGRKD